jgi:hypothetical protein
MGVRRANIYLREMELRVSKEATSADPRVTALALALVRRPALKLAGEATRTC